MPNLPIKKACAEPNLRSVRAAGPRAREGNGCAIKTHAGRNRARGARAAAALRLRERGAARHGGSLPPFLPPSLLRTLCLPLSS